MLTYLDIHRSMSENMNNSLKKNFTCIFPQWTRCDSRPIFKRTATGCHQKDFAIVMSDRDECRERFKGIHTVGTPW